MGDWNATVVGTGVHHNKPPDGIPNDADRLFDEFVSKLRAAGHVVHHASFVYGGKQEPRAEESA